MCYAHTKAGVRR